MLSEELRDLLKELSTYKDELIYYENLTPIEQCMTYAIGASVCLVGSFTVKKNSKVQQCIKLLEDKIDRLLPLIRAGNDEISAAFSS